MKGDIPIVGIIIAVVIGLALLITFLLRYTEFGGVINKADCDADIQKACNSGQEEDFKAIPLRCSVFYSEVTECRNSPRVISSAQGSQAQPPAPQLHEKCVTLCKKVGSLVTS